MMSLGQILVVKEKAAHRHRIARIYGNDRKAPTNVRREVDGRDRREL